MQPAKINYKIYQGSTFQETLRWESETKVYAPISAISKSAPCVITTTNPHSLPVGWRFRVAGAGGMKEINSVGDDAYYLSTAVTVVPPTLINEQELEDIYLGELETWNDMKAQDAQTVAPTIRPWANLTTQQTYQLIMSAGQQISPAVPNAFAPKLQSVNTAYLNWQNAITANQATVAAAQAAIANKIEINQTNSLGYTTFTSGGVVEYNKPIPLSGYTAQMQIRESLDSTTVIHQMTSAAGQGIQISTSDSTIFLSIPASVTRDFTFDSAVYSLELTNSSGVVTPFMAGNLTLIREVTR